MTPVSIDVIAIFFALTVSILLEDDSQNEMKFRYYGP